MRVSLRAAISVALLVGFYVLAFGLIGGLLALETYALIERPLVGVKLALFVVPAVYALVKGLISLERRARDEVPGILVTPEEQPALWDLVRRLAADAGTCPPDEIRILAAVNAGVAEDTRFLGLHVLRRRMFIGAPLLTSLTEKQLIAVLAHELGHYANKDTRLDGLVVSGREAVLRAGSRMNAEKWFQRMIAKLFRGYAKLYLLVSQAISRRQEFAADRLAATLAGSSAAASALRELPVIDAAWNLFTDRHLTVAWELGYLPTTFFDGFARLRTSPELHEELEEIRQHPHDPDRGPYDSHPPLRARIAAIESLGLEPESGWGDRPALELLTDPMPLLDAAVLSTLVSDAAEKERVDWATLGHIGARARVVRGTKRLLETSAVKMNQRPSLTTVLDALDAGHLADLGSHLPGNSGAGARARREMARGEVLPELSALVALAFSDAGLARWDLDWLGRTTFVTSSHDFDMAEHLDAAVADHGSTEGLRAALAVAGVAPDYRPAH
ncbi:Zn-dependent protease with chaperone function [Lentzea waywayandensis]|uniref:Zn-dependent protease with chaperone function n=1 Tax=Lentzea waywayandensis TaxID=84724 RepID=A0A1I6EU65_9PSEU|nr:M48 family metallopeptidase [Lentzea waywayandensis]SFR21072.1 Zn-dependent protease with chaperone function [Lentzea waywayandensis]